MVFHPLLVEYYRSCYFVAVVNVAWWCFDLMLLLYAGLLVGGGTSDWQEERTRLERDYAHLVAQQQVRGTTHFTHHSFVAVGSVKPFSYRLRCWMYVARVFGDSMPRNFAQ